jgi:hypothetical protein
MSGDNGLALAPNDMSWIQFTVAATNGLALFACNMSGNDSPAFLVVVILGAL